MFSWNVLTHFYSEDVTYSKNDLEERKDALGVTTLLYLQTLYKADWSNFLERLHIKDGENVWSKKYINKTWLWASLRSQTLTKPVTGMMYYEKALRLLANLERIDEETINDLMFILFLLRATDTEKFKKSTVLGCLVIQYLVKESPKTRIMR